jgi:uncharacterized protein (DUF2267 family)
MKKLNLSLFLILFVSSVFSQTPYERVPFEKTIKPNKVTRNTYLFVNPLAQEPHQCQTTCTSMLLSYDGINIPPFALEMETTGRLDGTPTMSAIVNTLLKKWNIKLTMSRYEVKYSSVDHIIEFFKELLDKNTPCYFLANYHAIVVQGYDQGTRKIYCIDPTRADKVLAFTYQDFVQYIRNSAEYKKNQKILIAHKPIKLNNFIYLENGTFIYKGALR